jgi:hypothetical protein
MTDSLNLTTVPIHVEGCPETGLLRLTNTEADGTGREVITLPEESAQALIGAIAAMAPRRPDKPAARNDYEVAVASGTEWGPVEVAVRQTGFDRTVLLRQEGDADEERETLELDTLVIDAGKLGLFIEVLQSFHSEALD